MRLTQWNGKSRPSTSPDCWTINSRFLSTGTLNESKRAMEKSAIPKWMYLEKSLGKSTMVVFTCKDPGKYDWTCKIQGFPWIPVSVSYAKTGSLRFFIMAYSFEGSPHQNSHSTWLTVSSWYRSIEPTACLGCPRPWWPGKRLNQAAGQCGPSPATCGKTQAPLNWKTHMDLEQAQVLGCLSLQSLCYLVVGSPSLQVRTMIPKPWGPNLLKTNRKQ